MFTPVAVEYPWRWWVKSTSSWSQQNTNIFYIFRSCTIICGPINWWVDARKTQLQWLSNVVMSFLHQPIEIWVSIGFSESYKNPPLCWHQLEQLERLRSEDTPRRPMITLTNDQFILNLKSILLTTIDQFISDPKSKQGERRIIRKFAKNLNFRILL